MMTEEGMMAEEELAIELTVKIISGLLKEGIIIHNPDDEPETETQKEIFDKVMEA